MTYFPNDFIPIALEQRSHVSTKIMCIHLGHQEQTARAWAANDTGPLKSIKVEGKRLWPVSDIRRVLGLSS